MMATNCTRKQKVRRSTMHCPHSNVMFFVELSRSINTWIWSYHFIFSGTANIAPQACATRPNNDRGQCCYAVCKWWFHTHRSVHFWIASPSAANNHATTWHFASDHRRNTGTTDSIHNNNRDCWSDAYSDEWIPDSAAGYLCHHNASAPEGLKAN